MRAREQLPRGWDWPAPWAVEEHRAHLEISKLRWSKDAKEQDAYVKRHMNDFKGTPVPAAGSKFAQRCIAEALRQWPNHAMVSSREDFFRLYLGHFCRDWRKYASGELL